MLKTETYLEKSFELWPGLLRFAASGEGAHAALDAGMDAARDLAGTLVADAELIANSNGSVDILPRGPAGRRVPDVLRALSQATGATKAVHLPPPLVALCGAACDVVLEAMRKAGAGAFLIVTLGDAVAFQTESGSDLPANASMPLVAREFLHALGDTQSGGVALAGAEAHFPGAGIADRIAIHARSAAQASLAAAYIGDGMTLRGIPRRRARIADPLVVRAVEGRMLAGDVGLLPPETIWEVLSAGIKRASGLREKRLLSAAALSLKGRGRTLGPIDGDRLLRFGVSEWR